MRSYLALAGKLAAAYLLFSILWIFLSDSLLSFLFSNPKQIAVLQTSKGLLFVVLSSIAIGALALFLGERLERTATLLQQRTSELAEVEEQGNLGSWRHDGQFHWSSQAAKLLGSAPACSLEAMLLLISPGDRNGLQRALIGCLDGQQDGFNLHLRLNRAPAPHVSQWLQICAQRSATDGHLHGTLRDVTSQRLDQEALRESEQRFRRLLEQTPRIAVQAYDRERRVIFWNTSSERLYGYSLTEALGRRLEELIIPEPMQDRVISDIQRWMSGGPPLPPSEMALKRKDGSLVWVYSSHLLLRNRQNQPEMYCLDIDLSELKQTSMALHNSELRFRQLVEQLGEAIFLCDAQLHLRFVNPAWLSLHKCSESDSLGQPLWLFFDPEDAALVRERAAAILNGQEQHWSRELRLRSDTRQTRWARLEIARDALDGGLRGSLTDTQLQHHNRLLQEARNATLDALLGHRPLQEILLDITQRLQQINPRMRTSIMLKDADNRLHTAAAPTLPTAYLQAIEGIEALPGVGSCGHAAATGELTIAADLQQHPNWANYRQLVESFGLRACWSLPFKNEHDEVLGTFGVYYEEPTQPCASDIRLVADFTRLIVLAIEQSRREVDREDSEQRFRATFEQAASGLALVSTQGRFLRVNRHICELLGYSEAELLHMTFQDVTHPDDIDNDLQQARRLRDGEITGYSLDKRYRRKDGSLLWGRLDVALHRNAQGQPQLYISSVQDIGWRKQQERELQLAATVFHNSHEAMVLVDIQRRVITANPAFTRLTGLPLEQLLGRRLPPPDRHRTGRAQLRQLWRQLQEHGHWSGELQAQFGNQPHQLWLSASRTGTRDSQAEETQYILLFNDLNPRQNTTSDEGNHRAWS